jgi:hypothetical protein
MPSLTQEQFEEKLLRPAVERLGELGDEIAKAENDLDELVVATDVRLKGGYDDDAADEAELHLARLRREQARLERRVRALSNRLGHVSGTGRKLDV